MCETGHADGCREFGRYHVQTTHVANPGLSSVTLDACREHLAEAVTEMLSANASLRAQGMRTLPGLRLGHLDLGVSVIAVAPSCAVCSKLLERVNVNTPDEWAHADPEPADRHAPVLDTGRDVIADDAQLSRIESSACDR